MGKTLLYAGLALAVVLLVVAIPFLAKLTRMTGLKSMEFPNVNLGSIADGVYLGAYDVGAISVEVKVTVKDHVIKGIELVKHLNGQGKPAEVIPGRVLEAQSLQVDVVSGATYSSKVILKAIENALGSAAQ